MIIYKQYELFDVICYHSAADKSLLVLSCKVKICPLPNRLVIRQKSGSGAVGHNI